MDGIHMKTTIDIADPLLTEARDLAVREGVTLRAVVERGLRRVLSDASPKAPFRLRPASFNGRGLRPELADAGWERVRDTAYEGRGG
jgi:hypothetical protein